MAKSNRKKPFQITPKRKVMIVLLLLATVFAVLIAVLALVNNFEENRIIEGQRGTLNRSLSEVSKVYYSFVDGVSYEKELVRKPINSCADRTHKFDKKEYGCSTRAVVRVSNIDEDQFLALNEQAVGAYHENGSFQILKVEQPRRLSFSSGLVGRTSSKFAGSDIYCYLTSDYSPEKKSGSFSFSCNVTSSSQLFPSR